MELTCFIFPSWLEKCFEVIENTQRFECEGDWVKLRAEIVSSDNPSQNIWHKVKKYSKTGQDFENVISNFACFLTATVND